MLREFVGKELCDHEERKADNQVPILKMETIYFFETSMKFNQSNFTKYVKFRQKWDWNFILCFLDSSHTLCILCIICIAETQLTSSLRLSPSSVANCHSVKYFLICYGYRMFVTAIMRAHSWWLSWTREGKPNSAHESCFTEIVLIVSLYICPHDQLLSSIRIFRPEFTMHFSTLPSHEVGTLQCFEIEN
jgi:hypothetical protein